MDFFFFFFFSSRRRHTRCLSDWSSDVCSSDLQREAGGAAQGAHHGALLLGGLPGQPVRPAGAVPALGRAALAPLADGLGGDAVALGQHAGALAGAGDLGADGRGGAGVGVDREHQAVPPARRARSRPSKRQAYVSTAQRAWSQQRSAARQIKPAPKIFGRLTDVMAWASLRSAAPVGAAGKRSFPTKYE